jgi:hypothetical protein
MDKGRKPVLGYRWHSGRPGTSRTSEDLFDNPPSPHRVPGCVGGPVGGAHHAEGGQPHCQQVNRRPAILSHAHFSYYFAAGSGRITRSCHSEESLTRALRRPSRALDQSWRVLKVMTAYILRMALYWY